MFIEASLKCRRARKGMTRGILDYTLLIQLRLVVISEAFRVIFCHKTLRLGFLKPKPLMYLNRPSLSESLPGPKKQICVKKKASVRWRRRLGRGDVRICTYQVLQLITQQLLCKRNEEQLALSTILISSDKPL